MASTKNGVIPFVGYRTYRFTFIESYNMAFGPNFGDHMLAMGCLRLYNGLNIIPLTGVILTTNNPKTGASIGPLGEQNLLQATPNSTKIYQPEIGQPPPYYTYIDLTFQTPVIATSYALVNCNLPTSFGTNASHRIASWKVAGTNDYGRTLIVLDTKTRIIVSTVSYFENKYNTNIIL
jgi:hypothetical protein